MTARGAIAKDRAGVLHRAVTINDIAALSRVSSATVTRALQGHPRVLPETRRRVELAAAQLGYRPNHIARSLATGISKTVGLLIPTVGDAFWGAVSVGIEDVATRAGYSVIFANTHGSDERMRSATDLLLANRVDGIIIADEHRVTGSVAEEPPALPVVRIGSASAEDVCDLDEAMTLSPRVLRRWVDQRQQQAVRTIAPDDVGLAALALEHLIELGHRRVAFVGAAPIRSAVLRVAGFRLAAQRAGLRSPVILRCDNTLQSGRRAGELLLKRRTPPTAVVAYDDLVAVGVVSAAASRGISVPSELSVIGSDDIEIAAYLQPPLTTIRQPKTEIGQRAMETLLRAIEGRPALDEAPLDGSLIIRDSTGPHKTDSPARSIHRPPLNLR